MAVQWHVDEIQGTGATKTSAGWVLNQTARVWDIPGGLIGFDIINYAVAVLQAAGVEIGLRPLENIVLNCPIVEIQPTAVTSDSVAFNIKYEQYDFHTTIYEMSGSVSQVETDKTVTDPLNPVTVEYTYPADYEWNVDLKSKTKTQTGTVSKLIPEPSITIKRTIAGVTWQSLLEDKLFYEGTVNVGPWSVDLNAKPMQWLCVSLIATTNDNMITYDTQMTFLYRFDLWAETVRFIDPGTGQAPADLVSGTGYKTMAIYAMRDFDVLLS